MSIRCNEPVQAGVAENPDQTFGLKDTNWNVHLTGINNDSEMVSFNEIKCSYSPCVNMKCEIKSAELKYTDASGVVKKYDRSTVELVGLN